MVLLFVQRVEVGAWCQRTPIQGKGKNRGPIRGGSPVPCPGITPGRRIRPLSSSHGLLGKERVLTCLHHPPSPGMEQLEGHHAGCVVVVRGTWMGLDTKLSLSPPDPSWGWA